MKEKQVTEVKEVKEIVKKETPMEQKALNEMMRGLRKVAFKFVVSLKNSPDKEDQMKALTEVFNKACSAIKTLRDKAEFKDIVANMTAEEREMLRELLNA